MIDIQTIIDSKSADILISQMEKAERSEEHKHIFDIDENIKEGKKLLKKIVKQRSKNKC